MGQGILFKTGGRWDCICGDSKSLSFKIKVMSLLMGMQVKFNLQILGAQVKFNMQISHCLSSYPFPTTYILCP